MDSYRLDSTITKQEINTLTWDIHTTGSRETEATCLLRQTASARRPSASAQQGKSMGMIAAFLCALLVTLAVTINAAATIKIDPVNRNFIDESGRYE